MIKTYLAQSFDRWNQMTDDELMTEVKKRIPALGGVPNRGLLLKILVMDQVDKIN